MLYAKFPFTGLEDNTENSIFTARFLKHLNYLSTLSFTKIDS